MKLSFVLFRRNRMPNGHIFRGKDRLVKRVEPRHLRQITHNFAIEEQNMFYLRFPYLTEAESHGHTKDLGKKQKSFNEIIDNKRRMFKEDVTLYEQLGHLRVKESWD